MASAEDTAPSDPPSGATGGHRARSERRLERAKLARQLRDEQPHLDRERIADIIASRLGGPCSPRTVADYLWDPDGSKGRARKAGYRGVCERCGAPTSAGDGPGQARTVCGACTARGRPRRHSRQSITATLCAWYRAEGFWPTSTDLSRSYAARRGADALARYDRYGLAGKTVIRYFGSVRAAVEAARAQLGDTPGDGATATGAA